MAVITVLDFDIEGRDEVLAVPPVGAVGVEGDVVVCCIAVAPHLHALDGADTADTTKGVGTAVLVRPDDVKVKVVYEVLCAQVALEAVGPIGGCEFVPDLDMVVVYDGIVAGDVTYAVRLEEREIELHIAGVAVRSVARMQGVGEDVGRAVGRDCAGIGQRLAKHRGVEIRTKKTKAYGNARGPRLHSCIASEYGAAQC